MFSRTYVLRHGLKVDGQSHDVEPGASEELVAITVLENRAGGFPSCFRVEVERN